METGLQIRLSLTTVGMHMHTVCMTVYKLYVSLLTILQRNIYGRR